MIVSLHEWQKQRQPRTSEGDYVIFTQPELHRFCRNLLVQGGVLGAAITLVLLVFGWSFLR